MRQLRIGVMGPPGVGKREVIDSFLAQKDERFGQVFQVSNPSLTLTGEYGLAMGSFGTYREDLWAMFELLGSELFYNQQQYSYINNGTYFGPLAHAVANLESLQIGLQSPLVQAEAMARQATLAVLTMLAIENINYNFAFRLPWPTEQPEGTTDFEWYFGGKVERALSDVLTQLGVLGRIQVLAPGSPEEQAAEIVATINTDYDKIPDLDGDGASATDTPEPEPDAGATAATPAES